MLRSLFDDIKQQFAYGNMMIRLIIINVVVFVVINIIKIFMGGDGDVFRSFLYKFCVSHDAMENLKGPWRLFTSIFLHEDFWHVLWNMLVFYWFGRIVGDLLGDRRIFPVYLLGGMTGGLIILSTSLGFMDGESYLLGASAGIMAIMMVAGMKAPDYRIALLFLGDVKLKYIVAAVLFLDLVSIANYDNTGGHIAHLGGFFFGWLYMTALNRGIDMATPINNFMDSIVNFFTQAKRRQRPEKVFTNTTGKKSHQANHKTDKEDTSHQEKLDAILDKIKQSGYNSLTQPEKEFLFKASNKH